MILSAPYNFVPLSEHICEPKDLSLALSGAPSQDIPIEASMSGCIDVAITCETPTLVSWKEDKSKIKSFGRIEIDGQFVPCIPGSSWRGMIRNCLEIASFGRMALVEDQRTSMRDLNAVSDYRNNFTREIDRSYSSKVFAGWLQIINGAVMLTPCDFARVHHKDTLSVLSVQGVQDFRTRIEDQIKKHSKPHTKIGWETPAQYPRSTDTTIAEIVHRIYLEGRGTTLEKKLWVEDTEQVHVHFDGLRLTYRKASCEPTNLIGATSQKNGELVFTGMASDRKSMEFFFFDPKEAETVPPDVLRMFRDVHERQEKQSPTWQWRRQAFEAGPRIPVFFLRDGRKLRQIGLSMMFKMAGENSIHDLISNTNSAHVKIGDHAGLDLAARIFGQLGGNAAAHQQDEKSSFRTRVSFGWARAIPGTWVDGKVAKVHLQRPKPGFFPAYIRQRDFGGVDGQSLVKMGDKPLPYRTYMNWEGKPGNQEEIRGWKRYPVRNALPTPIGGEGSEASELMPIVAGPRGKPKFKAQLRYHNLHPIELGALLWVMNWGGDGQMRHSLGMGRPLGWGQVRVEASLTPEETTAVEVFKAAMEIWANGRAIPGGWVNSLQLCQLKAMANPGIGDRQQPNLRQMILDPDRRINHFSDARKSGSVLPEYAIDDLSNWFLGPDPKRVKGIQDFSENQRAQVPELIKAAASEFADRSRDREQTRRQQEENQRLIEQAAANADLFPPQSKVFLDDGADVKVVLEKDGNNWRFISKRSDGTGREKVKVSRLRPVP